VVLGLATGTLAYQTDGRGAGLMIAVACGILFWRMVAEMGPLFPKREARASSTEPAPQESTLVHQL
jgi:hypothetical protein